MPEDHNVDITADLARGVSVNLAGKLIGRALHIVSQILLARWLGPAVFGFYAIGWNVVRVVSTVLPLGIDVGLLEQGGGLWPNQRERAGRLALSGLWLTIIISFFACAVLFLGADTLAKAFGKNELGDVFRLFAIVLPFASGLKVAASATRISQNMSFSVLPEEIVQPASNLSLIALLILLGLSLPGAIWAALISFGLGFFLAVYYIKRIFVPRRLDLGFDLFLGKNLLFASAPIGAAAIFTTLMLLVDRILVGYYLSESDAGIYQAISIFAVFFVAVLSAIKFIVAPLVSAAFHAGDLAGLKQLYELSTRWGLFLSIPVAATLITAPKQSLDVVFGAGFGAGSVALVWLTISQIANLLSGPVDHFLIMTGHAGRWVRLTAAMFFLNIVLNWVLIPQLGILGASLASAAAFAGLSLFATIDVRRVLGIWPFSLGYAKGIAATAVMSFTLLVFSQLALAPALMLTGSAIVAFLSFFGTLWLLGFESEEVQLAEMVVANQLERKGKK